MACEVLNGFVLNMTTALTVIGRHLQWNRRGTTLLRIGCCLGISTVLSACAPTEPINGCTLAAANQREVLRAKGYLHPGIPARLLQLRYPSGPMGHMALI